MEYFNKDKKMINKYPFISCLAAPGPAVPQRRQPLQDKQNDADPDVCAHPESDPTGPRVQACPVLQRGGESE